MGSWSGEMTDQRFQTVDQPDIFKTLLSDLCKPTTFNFFVSFDVDTAEAAINVTSAELAACTDLYGDGEKKQCRWLNLWGWQNDHSDIIKEIARRYSISPRLTEVLCPKQRTCTIPSNNVNCRNISSAHGLQPLRSNSTADLESILLTSQSSQNKFTSSKLEKHPETLAELVDNLWHFCTVDSGDRYLCVGYNSLFGVTDNIVSATSSKPNVVRIWSTMLICDDGLVVSVFENPTGMTPGDVELVRKCQLNIFQNISKYGPNASNIIDNPLMQVAVRPFTQDPTTTNEFDPSSAASLIFYYLMDDWMTTYKLLMQRDHPYRRRLEELRVKMEVEAHVQLMKELHLLGKQLNILRLVYSSYEVIINRILVQQRYLTMPTSITRPTNRTHFFTNQRSTTHNTVPDSPIAELRGDQSIQISTSSLVRFERLLDRVRLYALNEIEECLSEKESLVFMNFNFISLKETQAVERLSRVTVLLAKATILFLPISILTGYFSIQNAEIAMLSLKAYWVTFAILIIVTFFILFLFGVASDTVEGKVVYRSFTKTFYYFARGKVKQR